MRVRGGLTRKPPEATSLYQQTRLFPADPPLGTYGLKEVTLLVAQET